jgi:hypothetical protein
LEASGSVNPICPISYPITSSAAARSVSGTSMPSALAVPRLIGELELGRLYDRQVGGLGALEDGAGIDPDLTIVSVKLVP